jgi:nicotinamide-nucleotide amidase
MTEDDVTHLARVLGNACRRRNVDVVTAESCTGGGVATAMTRISGSAKWFERGFVTYSNIAKKEMLGVSQATLAKYGAVSEQVAREMAAGALKHSRADVSVSVTGIAGPTGGSREKPVGLVWFGWGVRGGAIQTRMFRFDGDRVAVRIQSVAVALQGLIDLLRKSS